MIVLHKAATKLTRLAKHSYERSECFGNIALIGATATHEWGNVVGFLCIPLLVGLVLHLIVVLFEEAA